MAVISSNDRHSICNGGNDHGISCGTCTCAPSSQHRRCGDDDGDDGGSGSGHGSGGGPRHLKHII